MTSKRLLLGTALGITAGSLLLGSALAGHHEGDKEKGHHGKDHHGKMFEKADADGDGLLTPAEIEAARAAAFTRMDSNEDGFLTAEDHEAKKEKAESKGMHSGHHKMGKMHDDHMKQMDTDGDGKVSQAEFMAFKPPYLANADTDGDGNISKAELDAVKQERKAKWKEHKGKMKEAETE